MQRTIRKLEKEKPTQRFWAKRPKQAFHWRETQK
jgi:hypothetical protein